MKLSAIVAHDEDLVIGRDGALPWHLPRDLARFKAVTMGKPMIMGRRTYESIGRPLPGRTSIVLTGREDLRIEGALVARSLDEAIAIAESTGTDEALVIGGAVVYREALPLCQKLYVTEIEARVGGDVTFPRLDPETWEVTEEERQPADEKNPLNCVFKLYERRSPTREVD